MMDFLNTEQAHRRSISFFLRYQNDKSAQNQPVHGFSDKMNTVQTIDRRYGVKKVDPIDEFEVVIRFKYDCN